VPAGVPHRSLALCSRALAAGPALRVRRNAHVPVTLRLLRGRLGRRLLIAVPTLGIPLHGGRPRVRVLRAHGRLRSLARRSRAPRVGAPARPTPRRVRVPVTLRLLRGRLGRRPLIAVPTLGIPRRARRQRALALAARAAMVDAVATVPRAVQAVLGPPVTSRGREPRPRALAHRVDRETAGRHVIPAPIPAIPLRRVAAAARIAHLNRRCPRRSTWRCWTVLFAPNCVR
jgi:hypothetical protein